MGQYADDSINFHENYELFDKSSNTNPNFYHNYDMDHYFIRVNIDGILRETEKAYQFKKDKYSFWIPKALCRGLKKGSVLIWGNFNITFVEIVTADDINNMFDVIEDDEPDFTHLKFPTPFD